MNYEVSANKAFRIATDAVSVEIQAMDEDDAAIKFAAKEPIYAGSLCVADLVFRAKQMGGWVTVEEV